MPGVSQTIVVTIGVDAPTGQLPEARLVDRGFAYGGEATCTALAFAAAALGEDVELRGLIDSATFSRYLDAVGRAPRTDLRARLPRESDFVIVPEGLEDPMAYMRLALSPARIGLYLLAAPGLFGWPFTAEPWNRPDPLAVDIESLARPEHFAAMTACGFELFANSRGLVAAALAARAPCRYLGSTRPEGYPNPPQEKRTDVVALTENRWWPLARRVIAELEGEMSVERIPRVSNDRVLERLASARVLVWPSRVEGHATVPIEARAMRCVPVALDTNPFAAELDEEHGAVTVSRVDEIAPAIRALLADPARLDELADRGSAAARRHDDWADFLERVRGLLEAPGRPDPARPARAGFGIALTSLVEQMGAAHHETRQELAVAKQDLTEATKRQERLTYDVEFLTNQRDSLATELDALRRRKMVSAALRMERALRRR